MKYRNIKKTKKIKNKNKNKTKNSNQQKKGKKQHKGGGEKKQQHKTVGWKQLNCSPAVKGETVSETSCMVPAVLQRIKDEYNKDYPTQPITSTDPVQIWQELHRRLKECKHEKCWLKIIDDSNEKRAIKEKSFRPDQPSEWASNPDEWLSNYDIFNVVKQYEEEYPDFKLLGPSAIDFDKVLKHGKCVNQDICTYSLKHWMQKGKRNFAFSLNLDDHDEPGSHWVTVYVHIPSVQHHTSNGGKPQKKQTAESQQQQQQIPVGDSTDHAFIFYFDSAGNSVPSEVTKLMNRIKKDGAKMQPPIDFKVYHNSGHDHQKGNTECGMYSIFFIITMLIGNTPFHPEHMTFQERIELFIDKKNKIDDKVVFDYRDLYFNVREE